MGTLYIVSTPIGNLKDITLRALEVFEGVDLIACEDTRRTSLLLKTYNIKKPLISYFEHNEKGRIPQLIQKLLAGQNIALVSDAGTPLLSDPGFKLIRECVEKNIKVVPIPGASAILSALVTSGLASDRFFFLGYLPKRSGKRDRILKALPRMPQELKTTFILFESPYRVVELLKVIKKNIGNIEIVIARELTKMHEETMRGSIDELLKDFSVKGTKGELTIVLSL